MRGISFVNVMMFVMDDKVLLVDFFKAVEDDPRVNSRYISLYVSLFIFWIINDAENPLELFSKEVMGLTIVR